MPEPAQRGRFGHGASFLDRPAGTIEADRAEVSGGCEAERVLEAVLQRSAADPEFAADELDRDQLVRKFGNQLAGDPRVAKLSFTGDSSTGAQIMRTSSDNITRLSLELGGKSACIVFDDADLDKAVEGAIIAKYRNMGQTCVCTNRLYVQSGIHDRFVEKFASEVIKMKVGDGAEVGVVQGPLINAKAIEKVERHVADAVEAARVLAAQARQPAHRLKPGDRPRAGAHAG